MSARFACRPPRLLSLAVVAVLLPLAFAQSLTPTNWTAATDSQRSSKTQLYFKGEPQAALYPLTDDTEQSQDTAITGTVINTNADNLNQFGPQVIAFISCDLYLGEIQAPQIFNQAELAGSLAVVLYSWDSDYCAFKAGPAGNQGYGRIYSMESTVQTRSTIALINSEMNVMGSIGPGKASFSTNSTAQHTSNAPRSTAVAMIILYSITGVIAIMFIAIIITGAIKAHRHPERYGPRAVVGRARRSRAKGLAQAMLDTLPIVKFGDTDTQIPKSADMELGESRTASVTHIHDTEAGPDAVAAVQSTDGDTRPRDTSATPAAGEDAIEAGIAPAVADAPPHAPHATNVQHSDCAICAEEFEAGQDQRVLPCDHRFHPACIDPWLLNISGTCPMCRVNIGQSDEDGDEGGVDNVEGMPPPLATTESTEQGARVGVRRSLMLGVMGVRGHPDMMTQEERLLALRELRYREQWLLQQQRETGVEPTTEENRSNRRRLRNLLGRRATRTTDVPAAAAAPAPADATGATPAQQNATSS